ncbi:MAG: hypothetical protein EZS28_050027, partial [Streblomastix strix]
ELEHLKAFVVHESSVSFSFCIGASCSSSALLYVQTSELSVCLKFQRVETSQRSGTNDEIVSLPEDCLYSFGIRSVFLNFLVFHYLNWSPGIQQKQLKDALNHYGGQIMSDVNATERLRKLQVAQAWRKNPNRAWYSIFDIGSLVFCLFQLCSPLFFIFLIVKFFFCLAKHISGFNVIILVIVLPYCGGSVGVLQWSLDIFPYMADTPELFGFVWDIWFSVSKPGLEPTQWADSLFRNLANLEFSNSLGGHLNRSLNCVLII